MSEAMLIERAVRDILDRCLCITPGREVVLLYDEAKASLAVALARGLRERGCTSSLMALEATLTTLPDPVLRVFDDECVGLIALASHHMWAGLGLAKYFTMRDDTPSLKARCAPVFFDTVMPLASLLRVHGSDREADSAYAARLRERLPAHTMMRVLAPGGTDLRLCTRDWHVHGGGEILTGPIEDSISGVIVADASVFFDRVRVPITLTIRAGNLVEIACSTATDPVYTQYQKHMAGILAADPRHAQLAEMGIGINGRAELCGVIMEDETVQGTCHFCFGDNGPYGGRNTCSWHGGTVVVRQPCFETIGE